VNIMTREQLITFIAKIAEGHAGVAAGLSDAACHIQEQRFVELVVSLGKTGQALYNLYGDWLNADDERYEQNPSFSMWLQTLNAQQSR